MTTPHELFREVVGATGDRIAAIRAIRERFGLDPRQAKEVMLQVEGTASSLPEHEERLANSLVHALQPPEKAGHTTREVFERLKALTTDPTMQAYLQKKIDSLEGE